MKEGLQKSPAKKPLPKLQDMPADIIRALTEDGISEQLSRFVVTMEKLVDEMELMIKPLEDCEDAGAGEREPFVRQIASITDEVPESLKKVLDFVETNGFISRPQSEFEPADNDERGLLERFRRVNRLVTDLKASLTTCRVVLAIYKEFIERSDDLGGDALPASVRAIKAIAEADQVIDEIGDILGSDFEELEAGSSKDNKETTPPSVEAEEEEEKSIAENLSENLTLGGCALL